MKYKKGLVFLCLIICLFSIASVCASDINETVVANEDQSEELISVENQTDETLSSNSHNINTDNYDDYFDNEGKLISLNINDGDTVYIEGTFNTKNFIFNKSVDIIGLDYNYLKNCMFTFNGASSGSIISNLNIFNTKETTYGIFLNGTSNCVITNCFINNTGASSYAVCVANNANHNNITNNNLNAYGITYDQGTRSTSPLLVNGAHYNYIANNQIGCDDANAIYLSSYSGGLLKGGNSNFNWIYNNTITYHVLPTSWSYGVQLMGEYNVVDSNRIIGAYRGVSSQGSGNKIINNWIIKLTGAVYNHLGVPVGGDGGIICSANSVIRNNTIIYAKIISTGVGISAYDNSIIENNTIQIVSSTGIGIKSQGQNITIKNNNVYVNSYQNAIDVDEVDSNNIILLKNSTFNVVNKEFTIFYGENASFVISSDVDGVVHVKVDSYESAFKINNNTVVIEIPHLNASTDYYDVEFEFYPNNYSYSNSVKFAKIKVKKSESQVNVSDAYSFCQEETFLIANIASNNIVNEGNVSFYIGDRYIGNALVTEGIAKIKYNPTENVGEYEIRAIFNSNNYINSTNSAKLFVDAVSIELSCEEGVVGLKSIITANIKGIYKNIYDGQVSFYIEGKHLNTKGVINNSASIVYCPLEIGKYTINAIYSIDGKSSSAEDTITYTVNKADSITLIDNIGNIVDHIIVLVATVTSYNDLPVNEGNVIFFDGDLGIGSANVYNGKAMLSYTPLTVGKHNIRAIYMGDNYLSSSGNSVIIIQSQTTPTNPVSPVKPTTKTILTLKKVKVKRSAKKLTIQATLKINGKAFKGKIIKFKFNKKSYKAKTNAKGVAKITVKKSILKKLKKGKKVTYTATYGKITKKVTVKVKK